MERIFFVGSASGEASRGLRTFALDEATGALRPLACVEDAMNPIYQVLSADGRWLFSSEDVTAHAVAPDPKKPGGVSSFRVGPGGALERVASIPLAPTVPCHISLSPDGRLLAWAEYRTGHAGVVRVGADGSLEPIASLHHTGHGPNPVRQEAAHCHFAAFAPGGGPLLVCDLGLDHVFAYALDEAGGVLRHIVPSRDFAAPPGSGPRHIAFVPDSDLAVLVTEMGSGAILLRLSPGSPPETLDEHSLLPSGFMGETKAAAVRLSPDGAWVLASNRGHDSIAAFRIDRAAGRLVPGPISPLGGHFPRDFAFAPGGGLVVVGHKLSDEFAVYRFDAATGALTRIADAAATFAMPRPLCFTFA